MTAEEAKAVSPSATVAVAMAETTSNMEGMVSTRTTGRDGNTNSGGENSKRTHAMVGTGGTSKSIMGEICLRNCSQLHLEAKSQEYEVGDGL